MSANIKAAVSVHVLHAELAVLTSAFVSNGENLGPAAVCVPRLDGALAAYLRNSIGGGEQAAWLYYGTRVRLELETNLRINRLVAAVERLVTSGVDVDTALATVLKADYEAAMSEVDK